MVYRWCSGSGHLSEDLDGRSARLPPHPANISIQETQNSQEKKNKIHRVKEDENDIKEMGPTSLVSSLLQIAVREVDVRTLVRHI